jgi:hypothetical protein
MYLSPVVRTIRDDPVPDETVTLQVTLASDQEVAVDTLEGNVESVVRDRGGSVADRLEFDTLLVTVPHEGVEDLCTVAGIETIETADTLGITPGDAGEDVDYED